MRIGIIGAGVMGGLFGWRREKNGYRKPRCPKDECCARRAQPPGQDGALLKHPPWIVLDKSAIRTPSEWKLLYRINPDSIVNRGPNSLFASEVALGSLN
jgi:hypothetical protein